MFSDGGVNNFIMFSVANFSWGLNGPIFAHFFWDRVTHWSRNSCWGNGSISITGISISISFGSSLSSDEESLGVANEAMIAKNFMMRKWIKCGENFPPDLLTR